MVKIGDTVVIISASTEVEVKDIAILNFETLDRLTMAEGGQLCYFTDDYDWVLASECYVPGNESFFDQDARSPHLEELGYQMVGWKDDLEPRPDNENLPPIVTVLMAIQYDKEGSYGSSWKGKGEYRGIMANIDRKYDRLDNMTQQEIQGKIDSLVYLEEKLQEGTLIEEEVSESKIDAIADLTNYGLLYMTYVREHFPNVFNVWVKRNVPTYLLDKIRFVLR